MVKLETRKEKVKFIVGMFKLNQHNLNVPEQISLLTLWEHSCVIQEEYEVADALLKEIKIIQKNPNKVPQNLNISYEVVKKKLTKKPFYFKIFKWFKNLFKT